MQATITGRFALPGDTPNLAEFGEVLYGVQLGYIGEEGDVVMLGHPGKLRALAALRALLRGLGSIYDADEQIRVGDGDDLVDTLTYQHAINRTHCKDHPECRETDDLGQCYPCREIASYSWWLSMVDADTPGAFPVTCWNA